jgi:hypothetical protein
MNDRDQREGNSQPGPESHHDELEGTRAPIQDMEMFSALRDVIRAHYLWQWSESTRGTKTFVKGLTRQISHDPQFRLVGDIEVVDHILEVTLWLEETMAFSLASVDIMMLDAMQIDFRRGAVLARELTRLGLEYHLITFGDGKAQQFRINIVGPRMQQIRDLGTLVAPAVDTFSA